MKKTLVIALLIAVSAVAVAKAVEQNRTDTYALDENKVDSYQLDELVKQAESQSQASAAVANTTDEDDNTSSKPKIIIEETPAGRIEKLVDVDGHVIAEKTIENEKIVKKVLNYYYPDGILMRQITAKEDDSSFYAEEYYNNGKLASQATYLNEGNKVGKEKRYDAKGTLRQEIPWVLPETESKKPLSEQTTIRLGEIITYFPDGNVAAKFPVGREGKTIFYGRLGMPVKTIESTSLLKFSPELRAEDCKDVTLQLDLDELIELYEDEGDISYDKCGMPYRENFVYEIMDAQGGTATLLSYDEKGMLRRITPFVNGKKDGTAQKFDSAGNLTAEINYTNGYKEGYATGYFPNNNPAFLKKYIKGKVEGTMNCYFPDGKIAAQFFYKNGLKEGKAVVNSPIQKTLEFSHNELLNEYQKKSDRMMISSLKDLKTIETQCLNVANKISEIEQEIDASEKEVNKTLQVYVPEICADMSAFEMKQGLYFCYNEDNKRIATYPVNYISNDYVIEKIYTPEDKLLYEIPFKDKMRQGWSKQYNEKGEIIAQIYYDRGNISGVSHSYHENGRIKDLRKIADDGRETVAQYAENGDLEFNLLSKNGVKQNAYLISKDKRKEIAVKYYENKPDFVREVNLADPYNYAEYNFALGEYVFYENNQAVKGGKICQTQTSAPIDIIKENVTAINTNSIVKDTGTAVDDPIAKDFTDDKEPSSHAPSTIAAENIAAIDAAQKAANIDIPPVISEDEAPIIEDLEPEVNPLENVVVKTPEEEHQAELAAKNIGPIAKPEIENLTEAVQKEKLIEGLGYADNGTESKTERLYYPNGSLRKTIKTKGSRTEEIKEYSKNGLLLTDYMYNLDKIVIEKYFGSGEVRRKLEKSYDDNAITAFISRQDFFDTGKTRYAFKRQTNSLLFSEEKYYPDGALKAITEQTQPLSFKTKEYDSLANLQKEVEQDGLNELVKVYDGNHTLTKLTMNGKDIPLKLADNSADLFKDNARLYDVKGKLASSFKTVKDHNEILSYHGNGKVKIEILLYQSGEISVKQYNAEGALLKFAHLAPDGKLHIEKPAMRVIPNYRQRYWVEYNNPNWVENEEKYSIKSIGKLNLNIISKILAELGIDEPEIVRALNQKF